VDAHRLLSFLIVAAGAATSLLGLAIVTVALMVRVRANGSRSRRPSFDA